MVLKCLKDFTKIVSFHYMKLVFSVHKTIIFGCQQTKVYIFIFYAMMNKKISSSGACDIYPRFTHYFLVKFIVLLINFNVPVTMVVVIIHLVQIYCLLCLKIRWLILLQKQLLVFKVEINWRYTTIEV